MSAIFGAFGRRGRPVPAHEINQMSHALRAHGAPTGAVWTDGTIGLGHRMKCVTADDRDDRQPRVSPDARRVLVLDGRLYERAEIARELGVTIAPPRLVPDSQLVMRAYERWARGAAARLVGAFTWALWDRDAQALVVSRSHMGERPIYYYESSELFAFATAPSALFALPGIPRAIDEPFLADFLARERTEPGTSFYRGIRRLRAGHTLIVTPDQVTTSAHWRFDPSREVRFARDDDYVEAFRDVFERAVSDALPSDRRVGIMLSGGLDSSSVAATAAPQLARVNTTLESFTEVPAAGFKGATIAGRCASEESRVRELAAHYPNIAPHFVDTAGRFHLDGLDAFFDAAEVPYRNPTNRVWHEAIFARAREVGVGVILTGTNGNNTISWRGDALLPQLVRAGQWRRALSEAGAAARGSLPAAVRTLVAAGLMPLLPTPIFLAAKRVRHPFDADGSSRHPWRAYAAVRPEFAAEHRVYERARAEWDSRLRVSANPVETREKRYRSVERAQDLSDGVEAGLQARFDIDSRDPTGHVRVVEFCLALPEAQFARLGSPRWLIRRAMRERLPPAILEQRTRGLQAADWFDRTIAARPRLERALARLDEHDLAKRAVDLPRLRGYTRAIGRADPGSLATLGRYRGTLELGLMTGLFLRWFDGARE